MIPRRELLIGAACALAAGTAVALEPRRRVSLLGHRKLADIVPREFGTWTSQDVTDLVKPVQPNSLASRLYGEELARRYMTPSGDTEIAMLLAHGDSQTDELQLHRPEVCYPAVGWSIVKSTSAEVPMPGGGVLPVRHLVATKLGNQENIVYFTRLGEYFPVTGSQQRLDQLKTALGGYVADGLLGRFSSNGPDANAAFRALDAFIPVLVGAMAANARSALVGGRLAEAMATVHA